MTSPAAAADLTRKRPSSARSAVTNGALPGGVNPTSAEGRRFRDVVEGLTAEMGGSLSQGEELQVRTVAGLIVHAEQLQAAMLKGEPVDSEQLTRVSNSADRMLRGLRRARAKPRRRPGAPSIHEVLARRVAAE